MKKRILSLLVALVLALTLAGPAFATPPGSVWGEIVPLGPDSGQLTGTFTGSYTIVSSQGRVSRLVFDGSVNGDSGTLLINLVETGPQGIGYWTILDSTGDLSGYHGQGTFMFPTETAGSYEGQIHQDP